MELLKLAALCTVCLLPVVLLRGKNPEQALLLTLGIMLAAAARCLALAAPALEELRALFARTGLEEAHIAVLLKTVAALVLAMPLLRAVAELLLGFFG